MRAHVNHIIETSKKFQYKNILMNKRGMWNTLKAMFNKNESVTPQRIIKDGEQISSPKCIANIMNDHYIDKVEKIRAEFTPGNVDPIELLSKLTPKPSSSFSLKMASPDEIKKIIEQSKPTNTVGYDRISSRMIKLVPDIIHIHITHAINASISCNQFPYALKYQGYFPCTKTENLGQIRTVSDLWQISIQWRSCLKST